MLHEINKICGTQLPENCPSDNQFLTATMVAKEVLILKTCTNWRLTMIFSDTQLVDQTVFLTVPMRLDRFSYTGVPGYIQILVSSIRNGLGMS